MKIETNPRDDHQIQIVAEFDSEVLEKFKGQAARKISQGAKIPGFRPGKAPVDVIRRMYGEEAIEQEAVELMLDAVYPDVIKEADVKPFGPGSLEKIISINPPKLSFIIPLQPTVELGDYKTLRREYTPEPVSDDQVDQMIRNLRASYSTTEPVERAVALGDLVQTRLSGVLTHPAEGENAEAFKETPAQLIIGKNDLETEPWPYEGFSDELVGLSAGDEKKIIHTFGEDYIDPDLRGKEVEFSVTIQKVKELHLSELNDDFARTMGDFNTMEELRAGIRKQIEDNVRKEYDDEYVTAVVDEIVKTSTIKYPPQALEEEVHHLLEHLEDDLKQRHMDLATYLKTLNKEKEAFIEEEVKPAAIQRLERSLVLEEIAKAEKVTVDEKELQQEVSMMLAQFQSSPSFRKIKGRDAMQNLVSNVTYDTAARLLNKKTFEQIKAIATGKSEEKVVEETTPTSVESSSEEEPKKEE